MIQAEMKEKKPGYEERIKSLKSLLDKAQLMNNIRKGNNMEEYVNSDAIRAAAQSCSQLQVTAEPQQAEKKPGWLKNLFWTVFFVFVSRHCSDFELFTYL